MARNPRLPRHAWASIAWRTTSHLSVAVIASVVVSYLILETFSKGIGSVGLIASFVAPLILAGPMIFYMSLKHEELQHAYEQLEAAAARDSLTNCLHHGAFVEAVTRCLAGAHAGGALLVIDADHFKSINDQFGHASGDAALKLIAASIRQATGPGDVVGRLGGEEFGIFLPGADIARATGVADNLRLSIRTIEFDAGEQSCVLSVSIGGAVCSETIGFNELFRMADERLYKVKDDGRNNCDIVVIPPRAANELSPLPADAGLVYRGQKVHSA